MANTDERQNGILHFFPNFALNFFSTSFCEIVGSFTRAITANQVFQDPRSVYMPKQKKFRPQQELITEFISVIQRPKLKSYFKGIDIDHLMALLMQHGILIQVTSTIHICRDPKDNFLLALADDSKANYLITGDKDLLSLRRVNETNIITLNQFLQSYSLATL